MWHGTPTASVILHDTTYATAERAPPATSAACQLQTIIGPASLLLTLGMKGGPPPPTRPHGPPAAPARRNMHTVPYALPSTNSRCLPHAVHSSSMTCNMTIDTTYATAERAPPATSAACQLQTIIGPASLLLTLGMKGGPPPPTRPHGPPAAPARRNMHTVPYALPSTNSRCLPHAVHSSSMTCNMTIDMRTGNTATHDIWQAAAGMVPPP